MDHYSPGLHLLADIDTAHTQALIDVGACKALIQQLVLEHGLTSVGEVYHPFPDAGYTVTVCLTESHLSIHTWPEYGRVTLDVFLSNFKNNNHAKTESIFRALVAFYRPDRCVEHRLER